ncbi:MAG TPA: DUF6456 domain-containing protein [Sphingomonadales bacterium]|nr:DUF6456 domain-containing protein [Sphingomonadales bacterium]
MPRPPVSAFALRFLRALAGRSAEARNGMYRAGRAIAPGNVVRELLARDLLASTPSGGVALSEPGFMFLRRHGATPQRRQPRPAPPPDPFQAQHRQTVLAPRVIDGKRRRVEVNIGGSPLGWLSRRKGRGGAPFLNQALVEAGETLARDFELAGLQPRTIGFYDGVPVTGKKYASGQGRDWTPRQLDARRRVEKALAAAGAGLADVLVRVCCFHEGLEAAERALEWPTRSGKVVLKLALERLALHYGYIKNNQIG